MRALAILLLLCSFNTYGWEQLELDEKFVGNSNLIDYENAPEVNSWGKEDTFSSLLHLKERLTNNQNPVFVFVVDGGDLFEAENIAKFMNSPEGRSFRTIANYFVIDSRTLPQSPKLKKKILPGGNLYLMNRDLDVLAHSKVNYYQTKTGSDWWERIKKFMGQNKQAVEKVTERMRQKSDHELVKRFDESLEKIKNASFRERRKAIKNMKSLMPEIGFLLLPETNTKDPELSRTAEKLLLENQTSLNFPVSKKIPSWFNFDKQIALISKK